MKKFELHVEHLRMPLIMRTFEEFHGITACVITLNEEKKIVGFLEQIKPLVKSIVMIDGGSNDGTVQLAAPYVDILKVFPFKGHFGNQKNRALMMCRTDWVLFLDPDETLSIKLCKKLSSLIDQDEYDCYAFPRCEFIDGKEYNWVYPDYQDKLFRTYCRYIRPVHEEVVGFKNRLKIPKNADLDILHQKERERHDDRNSKYDYFSYNYYHEVGEPGVQTKETCQLKTTDLDKIEQEAKKLKKENKK